MKNLCSEHAVCTPNYHLPNLQLQEKYVDHTCCMFLIGDLAISSLTASFFCKALRMHRQNKASVLTWLTLPLNGEKTQAVKPEVARDFVV